MQEQCITALCVGLKACSKWSFTEARNGLSAAEMVPLYAVPFSAPNYFFSPFFSVLFSFALWLPFLWLWYSRPG